MPKVQDEVTEYSLALNSALQRLSIKKGGTIGGVGVLLSALTIIETYAKAIPRDVRQRVLGPMIVRLGELRDAP